MKENKTHTQLIWGIALLVMGILVLFKIPREIPRIKQFGQFYLPYIIFCFYFISVFLIAAGIRKIYHQLKKEP